MQRRVAIWILGAFKTSLHEGIEAIAGLIPIKLHLQNSGAEHNYELWLFHQIILSAHLWILPLGH